MKNLGIKAKLIFVFILIKVIPLILISFLAHQSIKHLESIFEKETRNALKTSYQVVENTANIAVNDSIIALDKKSQESLEILTKHVANDVADFLYSIDNDLLFLSKNKELNNSLFKSFFEAKTKKVIIPQEFTYDAKNDKWSVIKTQNIENNILDSSSLKYNEKYFNHINPKNFKTKSLKIYKEISFIDLEGNEKIKVSSIDKSLKNISNKNNTYCKAENYFNEIQKLKENEIYVSEVIGEYIKSNIIGTFTKQKAKKSGIEFKPKEHAYAGFENPKGKKFEGIIRFITPKYEKGKKVGYVSLALDHRHIMEYTDYLIPTKDMLANYSDASRGNYAFMWDYKGRNISHPRDYFIVGFNKNTGERVIPWLSLEISEKLKTSNKNWQEFLKDYPTFKEQSLSKKPDLNQLRKDGTIALDCRYLNFAPQCKGWMEVTKDGGYGSFVIFWSNVWKLTTVAAIPYYTGRYKNSKRGFGFVTFGANLNEFHEAANKTKDNIDNLVTQKLKEIEKSAQEVDIEMDKFVRGVIEELSITTLIMTIIVVLIAISIANYITRAINKLITGIEHFQNNDLDYKINIDSKDEMGTLAKAFNQMASSIKEQFKKEKQQEKILQEQSRLAQMGEILSMIAHQWKQPLGAINSAILSIKTKKQSNKYDLEKQIDREQFLEFIEKKHNNIYEYVQFLTNTVDDFRNFFKPQKDKEETPLTKPIEDSLHIVESSLINKGIKIIKDYQCEDCILIYKNELIQVILNILKNAEDNFMDKNINPCIIDIKTKKEASSYIIKIRDNGGGIASNIIDNIFDPYFSTKNEKNGTGLGLYISKVIIEEHHKGILSAKNIADGVEFSIVL